jgi:hypothetical protein
MVAQNTTEIDCAALMIKEMSGIVNNTICQPLFEMLSQPAIELNAVCSQPCWNDVVAAIIAIDEQGCWTESEMDVDTIKQLCDAHICESNTAKSCVSAWLAQGCPDEPPSSACRFYGMCAFRESYKCSTNQTNYNETEPIPMPTTPKLQDVRCLNNCSYHGVCKAQGLSNVGVCQCNKGFVLASIISFIILCSPTAVDMFSNPSQIRSHLALCSERLLRVQFGYLSRELQWPWHLYFFWVAHAMLMFRRIFWRHMCELGSLSRLGILQRVCAPFVAMSSHRRDSCSIT